jgi:lipopolysaccharide transport system permease protein
MSRRTAANPLQSLWESRHLIHTMTRREIESRYRGSWLGLLWAIANPLLLLLVYSFVFGIVFEARWPDLQSSDSASFAPLLFCGIIVYLLLAEVLTRAPRLIVENANYVKRVVFPLAALAPIALGSGLFHFAVSLLVLLGLIVVSGFALHLTLLLYLPLLLVPYLMLCLGIAWILCALGVYLRDLTYLSGFLATALLFLSPIFYPASAVPESFAAVMNANPLTFYIESIRGITLLGTAPDPIALTWSWGIAIGVFWLGYAFFRRVESGFADIL